MSNKVDAEEDDTWRKLRRTDQLRFSVIFYFCPWLGSIRTQLPKDDAKDSLLRLKK